MLGRVLNVLDDNVLIVFFMKFICDYFGLCIKLWM